MKKKKNKCLQTVALNSSKLLPVGSVMPKARALQPLFRSDPATTKGHPQRRGARKAPCESSRQQEGAGARKAPCEGLHLVNCRASTPTPRA